MLEEVPVVHRSQAEVLELPIAIAIDRVVQLPGVARRELQKASVDEPELVSHAYGLRECVDTLVLDLLVDVRGQETGAEPRVLRFVGDEARRGLDRELIQLARRRTVVETAYRLRGDAEGVDVCESLARTAHGSNDFFDVHGLPRAL